MLKVPDVVRECVVFLGYREKSGGYRRAGTGFFVTVDVEGARARILYLVTALHVVEACSRHGGGVHASCNTAGRPTWIELPQAEWIFPHADAPSDDIAVFPWWFRHTERIHYKSFPTEGVLTAEHIRRFGIGPGSGLQFPGLFVSHPGAERNTPIIRTGAIAAMPGEPVTLANGKKSSVYLVEARSIGGLSGSPVFIRPDGMLEMDPLGLQPEKDWRFQVVSLPFYLLGVMHGHWQVHSPIANIERAEMVNMGIGMVTPIDAVLPLLHTKEQAALRAKFAEQLASGKYDGEPTGDLRGPSPT